MAVTDKLDVCMYIQVIATAPYNPMLVLLGVPAIPAVLVTLEGADLDGRCNLVEIVYPRA